MRFSSTQSSVIKGDGTSAVSGYRCTMRFSSTSNTGAIKCHQGRWYLGGIRVQMHHEILIDEQHRRASRPIIRCEPFELDCMHDATPR